MDTLLNNWQPGKFLRPNQGETPGGSQKPSRGLTPADMDLGPAKPPPSPKPSPMPSKINTSVPPAPTPGPVDGADFTTTAVPNLNPGLGGGWNPFIQYHTIPSETPDAQDKMFLVSNGTSGSPILAHRRKDRIRDADLTTNKYYRIPFHIARHIERDLLSMKPPIDNLWRGAPNLTIRHSDTNFEMTENRELAELYGSEFTAQLFNRAMSDIFTNCSSRLIDPSTGELIIELCLDTLQPFEDYTKRDPSKIRTPCGKRYIELDAPDVGYSYQVGFVKRFCMSLRQNNRDKTWNLTILTHDGVYDPSWEDFEHRLHSGSLWTVHAIMDPRRILVDFIRTQLMWNDFTQNLRSTIAQLNSQAISRMDMPKAVDMLYRELHVLNDCELTLASNMNVISTLRDTLHFSDMELRQLGLPPNGNHVAMEIRNIYTELSHNMLFLQQLKQEVSTTIDMVFNTVQVDHGVLALKQGDLVYHQSESMKRLTYLTVFFLPATFVATIFGMNGPSTANPPLWLFFVVVIPISVLCFMVLYGLEYLATFRNKLLAVLRSPWNKLSDEPKIAYDEMGIDDMNGTTAVAYCMPSTRIDPQSAATEGYGTQIPQKAPDSPEYRPPNPQYPASTPFFAPSSPKYTASIPELASAGPKDSPRVSEYLPSSPCFSPSSPQDAPSGPEFPLEGPKVEFQTPSLAVPRPDLPWESADYRTENVEIRPGSSNILSHAPPESISKVSDHTRYKPSSRKDQEVDDWELSGQPLTSFMPVRPQQKQQQQQQQEQQQQQ
ncbi:hypothetical protein BZA77DRAFT_345152, partial [Pyronema omphalodes]